MKKLILGLLTITLIGCGLNNTNRVGSRSGNDNTWLGELKINNTRFLESYGLCGNTRSNIKRDLIASTTLGLLTGSLSWRNTINNGLGIAFNRGIIHNCGRMKKVLLALYSYQPLLPEGDSILFIEPVAVTRWNYSYGGAQQANDYSKLDNYIQAGTATSGSYTPPLILRQTDNANTTTATVSSYLWHQRANTRESPERLYVNRKLEIKTWRINQSSNSNKDIGIEIKKDGNIIGTSTLRFVQDRYYSKATPKIKRQVASFLGSLKNQSLLLGLASGLILLIITTLFLLPKKEES